MNCFYKKSLDQLGLCDRSLISNFLFVLTTWFFVCDMSHTVMHLLSEAFFCIFSDVRFILMTL